MLIQGRLLIDSEQPPAPGWIAIDDLRIVEMGLGEPVGPIDLGGDDVLICPGFIDGHLHLPQIDSIGCAPGVDLLDWLNTVIFPAEERWASPAWAAEQINRTHTRLLEAGTLGYAGYLTSHPHGPGLLVDALRRPPGAPPGAPTGGILGGERIPMRAIAGQVLMDRAGPPSLMFSAADHPAQPLVHHEGVRLTMSVNPRFAVSCSDRTLQQAADLAGDQWPIQTHLAESQGECEAVASLFGQDRHYTAVYDRHGLLGPRTLLAHCIHLSPEEWAIIAARQSVAVHCPTANTFLGSGIFDLRSAREHGVRLALGSDVAAGPDIAMPRVARAMIDTAKLRAMTIDPKAVVPTPAEAWRQITAGNAEALGWQDAGRLAIGASADLLLLRVPFDPDDEYLISRLLYTWRNDYIAERIIAGRVYRRADEEHDEG